MPENKWLDLFRFYDTIGPKGVTIECQRYIVIGETPQCYYVIRDHLRGYSNITAVIHLQPSNCAE